MPAFCYNVSMDKPVYVFDPTLTDQQSKVRGVGRYIQQLKENFGNELTFIGDLKSVQNDSVLINPFLDLLKPQIINKRYAKKQIAVIHDVIPLKYPKSFPIGLFGKIKLFFRKFVLGKYDLFITDSVASKNDIVKILKIQASKIQVIYPTVTKNFLPHLTMPPDENSQLLFQHGDNNTIMPTFTTVDEKLITNEKIKSVTNFVLYVGDATWNKNLPALLNTIRTANITCVCAGKVFENTDTAKLTHPWQKDLKWFLEQIKDDKRFVLLGYISDYELLYLYKKAKVNILLSYDEGFGLSYLEAGFLSTPSVISDIPVFREIAKDNALFAKLNDPVDAASKITELYYNPHRREIQSIKAFERAEDFHPKYFQQAWRNTIQLLLTPPVKLPSPPPKTAVK